MGYVYFNIEFYQINPYYFLFLLEKSKMNKYRYDFFATS